MSLSLRESYSLSWPWVYFYNFVVCCCPLIFRNWWWRWSLEGDYISNMHCQWFGWTDKYINKDWYYIFRLQYSIEEYLQCELDLTNLMALKANKSFLKTIQLCRNNWRRNRDFILNIFIIVVIKLTTQTIQQIEADKMQIFWSTCQSF